MGCLFWCSPNLICLGLQTLLDCLVMVAQVEHDSRRGKACHISKDCHSHLDPIIRDIENDLKAHEHEGDQDQDGQDKSLRDEAYQGSSQGMPEALLTIHSFHRVLSY